MIKTKIIDASVALKWFLDEGQGREQSLIILDHVKDDPRNYAVPDLFFHEMLSVFCRLLHDPRIINQYMQILQELGFIRLDLGFETVKTAVEIAKRYGIRGYDAVYAANAKLVKGIWLTADTKAHKKIAPLKISELVCV